MPRLRPLAFHFIRAVGGFAIAQWLTRRRLRILCYHGFSLGDEHEDFPYMFMRPETFERRMRILRRRRIPVVPLDAAIEKLRSGAIGNAEAVLTFDDGWASNLTVAVPALERFAYPACIYMTTEHLEAGTEAFNIAVFYMIQRSPRAEVTLTGLHPQIDGSYDLREDRRAVAMRLIATSERAMSLAERQALLPSIARALDLDPAEVFKRERFRLLDAEEMKETFRRGFDFQLHTHRHRLPDDSYAAAAEEIQLNRVTINRILGTTPRHFCYPSGKYGARHPEWLEALGVSTATTCDPGFNCGDSSPMLLRRYLDSELASDIEFEAEIAGVRELGRILRARWRRLRGSLCGPVDGPYGARSA